MRTWFREGDRAALLARIDRLSPDSTPRWGTMSVREMVVHLGDLVRVALHEKVCAPLGLPLSWPGISSFVVWVMPWPHGVATAPELNPKKGMTPPVEFERDRKALLALLQRFSEFPEDAAFGPSPAFGHMGRATWGRFMWRHIDHHLRQFGV